MRWLQRQPVICVYNSQISNSVTRSFLCLHFRSFLFMPFYPFDLWSCFCPLFCQTGQHGSRLWLFGSKWEIFTMHFFYDFYVFLRPKSDIYFIFLQNLNLILTEKCRDNRMCIFPVLLVSPELYLFALGFIPWYACAWQSHICKYMLKLVWCCLHIASVDKSLLRRMQPCAVCRNIAQNCDAILSYNAILPYCPALI